KTFNPLFVFGPAGVGKTHLIQAIGRIKERNPKARVLYITARLFQSQYTAAAAKNINSFFHFYQSIDTLIIDDIQDLQNMPGTQNTFFHIFNHLRQHDRQIIMSSDRSPAEMEGFEERLLSRFKWGMQVELERPDITLRRDVLKLKAEQDGLALPCDVAEFIASNVTNSVRELEGIVVSLMAHATVLNRDISLELARRVMANAVKINRRQVNFEMITEAVAAHYNISPDLLFTKTRKREVSDARQIVMYLAKKLAKMPLTTIGHKIDRTHATGIYACNNIEDRLATEKKLAADLDSIEAAINAN
ncbi:MAG: chromosomal replication initiator protein DnaA, partial [Muribaculaceae bacterium]|nr:chromosomal replication initiator protein DnaA [Muribaculaceae bacterium]